MPGVDTSLFLTLATLLDCESESPPLEQFLVHNVVLHLPHVPSDMQAWSYVLTGLL